MQSKIEYRHAVGAAGLLAVSATPAFAIPSPELVVGTLTSLSQLMALLSAVIGGGAVAAGARLNRTSGRSAARNLQRAILGAAVVAAAALVLNVYQFTSHRADERARLEAALVRPTPKSAIGQTLDTALKEIPYKDQMTHPLGLSTEEAEQIVRGVGNGTNPDWMILDIRESAEAEMGSFRNAQKVRFPDLASSAVNFTARKALLICHNGNRSAETCAALAEKGIDCRFIKGGLEKWLVEGRRLDGFSARTVDELRAIPDYANHQTLLDSGSVRQLVDEEDAIFVDVRYPGEFDAGHLPGAVNLPLRSMPSADVKRRLVELPNKPVIAPCYDRRSCFFGEILGLELTRAGHDFRGRYTVPWEYFIPSQRPPHVEAWLADANRSWWSRGVDQLTRALDFVAGKTGLPIALVVLALLSRILVAPFSIKAERDQITARRIAPELAGLKERLADDPVRLTRAVRELYRVSGLTPGRNLIALLFLPVLAMSVEAAVRVAGTRTEPFYWLPNLAVHDPLYLLSLGFGGLLTLYIHLALTTTRRHRLICWLVVAPLLVAAGAMLPAAANLYVIASGALLLLQRALVLGAWRRLGDPWRGLKRAAVRAMLGHAGLVPLSAPERLTGAGNKAFRLAELARLGMPVPRGIVLTENFLSAFEKRPPRWQRRSLARVWVALHAGRVAVRSSAAAEDGGLASFAGVFESVLEVSRKAGPDAVSKVLASFSNARVASYGAGGGARNILIQPMVDAEWAGVLFTEDPEAPGVMLVETVAGNGEKLVSGRARPQSFRYGRMSRRLAGSGTPPIDFAPLLGLSLRAEAHFGAPQDIEWAYRRGHFQILQSRDITARGLGASEAVYGEWRRLAALAHGHPHDGPVLMQNEMSEMLPRPTALSLSLLEKIWAGGGGVDQALRTLGFETSGGERARPLYVTAFGRLYTDTGEAASRAPRLSGLALRRVRRQAEQIACDFTDGFVPEFAREMQLLEAADFSRLTLAEIVSVTRDVSQRFAVRTHADVDVINIAAQIYLDDARRSLEAADLDPVAFLAGFPKTACSKALRAAAVAPEAKQLRLVEAAIGHRARCDYDLAEARYAEDASVLMRAASALFESDSSAAANDHLNDVTGLSADLSAKVTRARNFQTLKEDAKHHALRELAQLRRLALEIGARSGLGHLVFHLTIDELTALPGDGIETARLGAQKRQANFEAMKAASPLPVVLTADDLQRGPLPRDSREQNAGALKGTRVSGSGEITGRAVVVAPAICETGAPITGFSRGDILVAPMLHPAWLPEVIRAGGIVNEVGGWLSHMSIVAREHGIVKIVGVSGLASIIHGQRLRLCSDGRVEILEPAIASQQLAAE